MRIRASALFLSLGVTAILTAAPQADELSNLKAQLEALKQQMNALGQQLQVVTEKIERKGSEAVTLSLVNRIEGEAEAPAAGPEKHGFFERKNGAGLTFYTPHGELTTYGNLDVSLDVITKGFGGLVGPDGMPPVGALGWMPDISTNLSYVGVRGFETLKDLPFKFIYQLETQVDLASTSGTGETNSIESNVVKGALTSRNTFIGISSSKWGSLMVGKTDAPYKNSTMRMNPFSGMIGDYQAIMGNTGGDNRVEFGTRLDHSIWYESPVWKGVGFNVLYSPGQNRASNSDNLAAGESDCTGGNVPGSGGIVPITCSDGSFSDAVSASGSYTRGALYLTAAYERHMKVNRSSDITGLYASTTDESLKLQAEDTSDEDAAKLGVQYTLPGKTTVSGIFETLHRYVPADLQFQNERQRLGTWFALSRPVTKNTTLSLGWAHAFRTPGDPGQHNDSNATPPDGTPGVDATAGAHVDNTADLITAAIRRQLTKTFSLYGAWAMTRNGPAAHFDLGGGGRAVATDCHDASDATGGLVASNPHCWTGSQLKGVSIGMDWKF